MGGKEGQLVVGGVKEIEGKEVCEGQSLRGLKDGESCLTERRLRRFLPVL
jgi:proline racemase